MMLFLKGDFAACSPEIKEWDEPVIRTRSDGTKVVGRPSRGFGDAAFNYAGKFMQPEPWSNNKEVFWLKQYAEDMLLAEHGIKANFDFCLAGYYPDGETGIMHHSDTVPTLDDLVLSMSFGAARLFVQRDYQSNVKAVTNTSNLFDMTGKPCMDTYYVMEHGDAILFDGYSQMTSTHDVPVAPKAGPRVNLTFRTGMTLGNTNG